MSGLIKVVCILSPKTFSFLQSKGVINAMPVYKDGSKRDPGNCRPVNQLLILLGKSVETIIKDRINVNLKTVPTGSAKGGPACSSLKEPADIDK